MVQTIVPHQTDPKVKMANVVSFTRRLEKELEGGLRNLNKALGVRRRGRRGGKEAEEESSRGF